MMALKLAWRNIWRNKRRTILTALAITFALGLTVITRGLQLGIYEQTINYNVELSVGHLQIQHAEYWDEKTLQNTMEASEIDTAMLLALPGVRAVSPKLITEALVAVGDDNSAGARIQGVIPSREDRLSSIPENVIAGRWLTDSDTDGAALGKTLADNIEAAIGDTIMYFTQGRHGTTAAGLYVVRGIFRTGDQSIDAYTVFVPLAPFQQQLYAEGQLTHIALTVDDYRKVDRVVSDLRERYSSANIEVMDYTQLIPDIMSSIAFDKATGVVFLALLLGIAGFGILETILMSVMERYHEFGVMRAIGMRRHKLVTLVFFEAFLVAIIGVITGNLLGYGVNTWFLHNPITLQTYAGITQDFGFAPELIWLVDLADQALWTGVVFGITLAAASWPAWVAVRFNPVEAIRQA